MRALDIAGTGMQAQQTNIEVISNNIANLTTTGFKRRRAEFQDLIYQNLRRVGSNSSDSGSIVPSGAQVGLGVKTAAIYRSQRAGQPAADPTTASTSRCAATAISRSRCPPARPPITRDGTFSLSPARRDRHRRRLRRAAGRHDPVERDVGDDQRDRPGAGRRSTGRPRADDAGPDPAGDLPERGRASMRRATTCSCETAASGNAGSPARRPRPGFGSVLQGSSRARTPTW
jgi:flagellar basal body rod protein FlgC